MFSKLLRSAKTALQPAAPAALQYPETDLFPPTSAPKTPARVNMVTTRNMAKAGRDSDVEILTPSVQIQASSRKRLRRDLTSTPAANQDIAEAEPSSSTKKRRLTAQPKDSTVTESHSHSEVQLLVKEVINLDSAEEGGENKQAIPLPQKQQLSGVNDSTTVKQKENSATEKSSLKSSSAISLLSDDEEDLEPKASSQHIHSLLSDEEVEQPKAVGNQSLVTQSKLPKTIGSTEKTNNAKKDKSPKIEQKAAKESVAVPKPKHRRFGSEEPVAEIPSSDPIDNDDIEESEEDSSDDEAPEEVGTREAAEDAKKTVRAAAKAVEQLRATERRARQERDLALKKQAELNKKRKRKSVNEEPADEAEESELSRKRGSKETIADAGQTDINDIAMEDTPERTELNHESRTKKSRSQKISENNLPDFLPMEYLEDAADEPTTLAPIESTQPRPRKTKFLDLAEKKTKDKKKGSTTYRVRESEQNARLAPKASKSSMSLKEAWLSGGVRKNGKGGNLRKPMKSSFFVNGKSGAGKR